MCVIESTNLIRLSVSRSGLLSARLTVAVDTPASRATSWIVAVLWTWRFCIDGLKGGLTRLGSCFEM